MQHGAGQDYRGRADHGSHREVKPTDQENQGLPNRQDGEGSDLRRQPLEVRGGEKDRDENDGDQENEGQCGQRWWDFREQSDDRADSM
jgi:hypothetical protein